MASTACTASKASPATTALRQLRWPRRPHGRCRPRRPRGLNGLDGFNVAGGLNGFDVLDGLGGPHGLECLISPDAANPRLIVFIKLMGFGVSSELVNQDVMPRVATLATSFVKVKHDKIARRLQAVAAVHVEASVPSCVGAQLGPQLASPADSTAQTLAVPSRLNSWFLNSPTPWRGTFKKRTRIAPPNQQLASPLAESTARTLVVPSRLHGWRQPRWPRRSRGRRRLRRPLRPRRPRWLQRPTALLATKASTACR